MQKIVGYWVGGVFMLSYAFSYLWGVGEPLRPVIEPIVNGIFDAFQ